MTVNLVTGILPILGRSVDIGFNVFDVMHHGLHEKQISNVFRWLLEVNGTHNLGDIFIKIFIDQVNESRHISEPLPQNGYWVRQEVNTSISTDPADIADLVLENDLAVLVVENYFTSDGHGHDYHRYLTYSQRDGRRGVVVLLCRDVDHALQSGGWEYAPVVTYASLVSRLYSVLEHNVNYQRDNPDVYSFLMQMYRKFIVGKGLVDEQDVLGFVIAMCETGEAGRYQEARQAVAAEKFASDLAEQARERFGEGRVLLRNLKRRLNNYSNETLKFQLNRTLGEGYIQEVNARYAGIYQWTVNFTTRVEGHVAFQIKFGPSAWFANERDPEWNFRVNLEEVDYSHLFLTNIKNMGIRQTSVTIQEVLEGLTSNDLRLHDEIIELLNITT